jgi:hypothetical protein
MFLSPFGVRIQLSTTFGNRRTGPLAFRPKLGPAPLLDDADRPHSGGLARQVGVVEHKFSIVPALRTRYLERVCRAGAEGRHN